MWNLSVGPGRSIKLHVRCSYAYIRGMSLGCRSRRVPSILPSVTVVKSKSRVKHKKPSSVGEGSLGQQPTHYENTTINTNVVHKVLRFSLQERIMCKILSHRKSY